MWHDVQSPCWFCILHWGWGYRPTMQERECSAGDRLIIERHTMTDDRWRFKDSPPATRRIRHFIKSYISRSLQATNVNPRLGCSCCCMYTVKLLRLYRRRILDRVMLSEQSLDKVGRRRWRASPSLLITHVTSSENRDYESRRELFYLSQIDRYKMAAGLRWFAVKYRPKPN